MAQASIPFTLGVVMESSLKSVYSIDPLPVRVSNMFCLQRFTMDFLPSSKWSLFTKN